MENQQVFYKVHRWAGKHSEIKKVIATRSTDKTIWFMRNNIEQRELLSSSYYQYCTSEDYAKAIIDSRNKAKADKDEQDRIRKAAPALLQALEAAKSKIECSQRAHERASVILVDEALEIIDAAIAAARGTV